MNVIMFIALMKTNRKEEYNSKMGLDSESISKSTLTKFTVNPKDAIPNNSLAFLSFWCLQKAIKMIPPSTWSMVSNRSSSS